MEEKTAEQLNEEVEANYKVITKLIGPIKPQGESHTDSERLNNQLIMQGLVEKLMWDIEEVSQNIDRHEHSMKTAGGKAHNFLIEMSAMRN